MPRKVEVPKGGPRVGGVLGRVLGDGGEAEDVRGVERLGKTGEPDGGIEDVEIERLGYDNPGGRGRRVGRGD